MTILTKPRSVKVVDITNLVPEEWDWFWDMLSSSNPDFSFGDNNLTLIQAQRFARFIDDAFEWFSQGADDVASQEDWKVFIDEIWGLSKDQIYVNMEA